MNGKGNAGQKGLEVEQFCCLVTVTPRRTPLPRPTEQTSKSHALGQHFECENTTKSWRLGRRIVDSVNPTCKSDCCLASERNLPRCSRSPPSSYLPNPIITLFRTSAAAASPPPTTRMIGQTTLLWTGKYSNSLFIHFKTN